MTNSANNKLRIHIRVTRFPRPKARCRRSCRLRTHRPPGLDDLVDEQHLLRHRRRDRDGLLLHVVVVPDALGRGHQVLARVQVHAHVPAVLVVNVEQSQHHLAAVEPRVVRQRLGNRQQTLRKHLHAVLGLALDLGQVLHQLVVDVQLHGAGAGQDEPVLDGVVDGAQAVADRVLDLGNAVVARALDQQRAAARVAHPLDEGVLLLPHHLLVNHVRETQILLREPLHAVARVAAAAQRQALHVPALHAAQPDDALARQHVQRRRVYPLLVEHAEGEAVLRRADLALQVNDLLDLLVGEAALGRDQALPLLRAGVGEARVHLALFVLQRAVQRQDVGLLDALRHVGVPGPVVQHHAAHKLRLRGQAVAHVQHLHHEQVERLVGAVDEPQRLQRLVCDVQRERARKLGAHARLGYAGQQLPVELVVDPHGHLELLHVLQRLLQRRCEAVGDELGVHPLVQHVLLAVLHQAGREHHVRGRAVARDLVHRRGRAAQNHRRRVLNHHFAQQHASVLGDFDVARSVDQHLAGPLGAQVRLDDVAQALGCVDVGRQRGHGLQAVCLSVQDVDRHFAFASSGAVCVLVRVRAGPCACWSVCRRRVIRRRGGTVLVAIRAQSSQLS
ncbi:ABC transporter permease [Babesia caballi]|uniref:ABC transporter permease n=1 Tax=Babesia caballi TaxID=5871 RepID=A0AAV4M504_BABCB|nr:ABC transporter permease [Babesia caballi]